MTKKIEELKDAELDQVTGAGDSKHKDWIPILSVDQTETQAAGHVEREYVSFTYDKITWEE